MKNKALYITSILVLASTFFIFQIVEEGNARKAKNSSTAGDVDTILTHNTAVHAKQPSAILASQPLPPPDTPLSNIYSDLLARSNAGDANAAMRLFSDLTKCKSREKKMSQVNHLSFPSKDNGEGIAHPQLVDKDLRDLEAADRLCKDISNTAIETRGDQLRQAALDGDAEAMVCYSMSTADVGPNYLTNSWFDYADRWIQEAPSFAQKAFEMGQADVIPLLIDAYTPSDPSSMKNYQFSELISPDAQKAYGLALLYKRLVPSSSIDAAESIASRLGANLSLGQRLSAQQFADATWPKFAQSAASEKNIGPCFGVY